MKTLRTEIINHIIGHNAHLKDTIGKKSDIILLRNCHPRQRVEYAKKMYFAGELSKTAMEQVVGEIRD